MADLTTLEKKKQLLAQQKARRQTQETLLKIQARKAQLSRHIRIGELAERAGIHGMDPTALLGAFRAIAEDVKDPKIVDAWIRKGEKKLLQKMQLFK